jgi:hypothetical protein
MSWRGALAVVVLAGAVAAACGGAMPRAQYERELGKIHDKRNQAVGQLNSAEPDDVQFFVDTQRDMQLAAQDLDRIRPPGDLKQAHKAYVESLYGLAQVLGRLADCARLGKRDEQAARDCRRKIDQSLLDEEQNDFDEAYTIYREQGFKLSKPPQ